MLACSMHTGCLHTFIFQAAALIHMPVCRQVPEWLEEPLLHLVHHSTTTLEGLIDKALAKFDGRYVVGEELAATDEGKERPCVIRAITSAKRPEGETELLAICLAHKSGLLHAALCSR